MSSRRGRGPEDFPYRPEKQEVSNELIQEVEESFSNISASYYEKLKEDYDHAINSGNSLDFLKNLQKRHEKFDKTAEEEENEDIKRLSETIRKFLEDY